MKLLASVIGLLTPAMLFAASAEGQKSAQWIFDEHTDSQIKMILTSAVMLILIIIIATEKIHRTMAAMLTGALLILATHTLGNYWEMFHFISFQDAFIGGMHNGVYHPPAVNYDVIGLLAGMMIVVGVLSETGVFEWLALTLFQKSKGQIWPLIVLFCVTTAIVSAFLDNVTTVILITPIAIQITRILKMNPLALLIPIIMSSNIGGAATLIGDPPNIIIGAESGLSFNAFISRLGIPMIIIMTIILFQMKFVYRKDLANQKKIDLEKEVERLAPECRIKHVKLLKTSLSILVGIVILFFLHSFFHMPASVPALAGAAILMFFRDRAIMKRLADKGRTKDGVYEGSTKEMETGALKAFEHDIEWVVLAFFAFLFVVVGAVERSGALTIVGQYISDTFSGGMFGFDGLLVTMIVILWVAAIASAFLDNIPFTIVMLPIVTALIAGDGVFANNSMNTILWWALSMGACLGGNGTVIASSANIVTAGIMEKEGIHMSFGDFFKVGFPSMIIQIFLAMIALIIMYNIGFV